MRLPYNTLVWNTIPTRFGNPSVSVRRIGVPEHLARARMGRKLFYTTAISGSTHAVVQALFQKTVSYRLIPHTFHRLIY